MLFLSAEIGELSVGEKENAQGMCGPIFQLMTYLGTCKHLQFRARRNHQCFLQVINDPCSQVVRMFEEVSIWLPQVIDGGSNSLKVHLRNDDSSQIPCEEVGQSPMMYGVREASEFGRMAGVHLVDPWFVPLSLLGLKGTEKSASVVVQ